MYKTMNETHLRIQARQMIGEGYGCLDHSIRAASAAGMPLDLATLKKAREIEESEGCRLPIIRLIDREIRKQENSKSGQALAA
jgi:hypothetical protein